MLKRSLSIFRNLELLLEILAAISLVAITLIVSTDAIGRYAFNKPIRWSTEAISLYLLPMLFFLALPVSFARQAHVAVDVAMHHAPPLLKAAAGMLVHVAGITFFSLILYFNCIRLCVTFREHELVPGVILWPLWPSLLILCIGCSLAALRCLINLCADLAAIWEKGVSGAAALNMMKNPSVE